MANLYDRLKQFQKLTSDGAPASPQPETPPEVSKSPAPLPAKAEALLSIPGVVRGQDLLHSIQKRDADKKRFLLSIGVEETSSPGGSYAVKETFYPLHSLPYGGEEITCLEAATLAGDERLSGISGQDILFIDTETTGLAGGTGTVPFMIGVGYFTDSGLTVRQFFMRDYDDEPAVLEELYSLIQRFPALGSFNGKSFDLPLLQSRFLLNRRRINLADRPHFDLLYPSRRFWKEILPNCRLSMLEQAIFGRTREDDLPSEQIPYVYFDFLRGIRIARMKSVFAHNAEDIRTLALLAAKACRLLREPLAECTHAMELWGLSRYSIGGERWDEAVYFLQQALCRPDLKGEPRRKVQWHLSLIHKRRENFSEAFQVWKSMVEECNDCLACIEMAKYLEHREKQIEDALNFTEQALEQIRFGATPIGNTHELIQPLLHRRTRLLRKLQRV